ncbi:hypothetical protein [Streptomyces sp. NPDC051561]|uniref:hypothetical protein n=1 Tax=Streptomyces sp. NPDC051561 TaxID=3365658 RepID=UPI0037BC72B8
MIETATIKYGDSISTLLQGLEPTPRNLFSAIAALARIDELGWEPRTGYPGSDVHWTVQCLVCGWVGPRFYSHLRRARPLGRHPGCVPQTERLRMLAKLSKQTTRACWCPNPHATTPDEIAEAFAEIADARHQADDARLLLPLRRLLGICSATAVRAEAAAQYKAAA